MNKLNSADKKETIKSIPIFSELSTEQLRKFAAISRVKRFQKGSNLFLAGELYKGFFILLKGCVKVYDLTPEGKEAVIHIVTPINIFADVPLFEGSDYPVNAGAIDDSVVLFIPKEEFIALIKENYEIALKMLGGFAKRMRVLVKQIEDLSTKEVINRLAEYILREVRKANTSELPEPFVKLTVPKSVIASYIGTTTETFSRTLHKLQKENVIRVKNKKIFVNDLTRLKELAGE